LLPTGNFLPQGNESGNKLPPSKVISGGFNEALGFFQKIVQQSVLANAKNSGRSQSSSSKF